MPAKSKQQQKFMGIVRAIQKGEAPASKFSKKARDVAKKMGEKDVEKYASTKHKGLPKKVKQEMKLHENPAAIAATQAMTKLKLKNPKTGKEVSAASALKNKDNPNHKGKPFIISIGSSFPRISSFLILEEILHERNPACWRKWNPALSFDPGSFKTTDAGL